MGKWSGRAPFGSRDWLFKDAYNLAMIEKTTNEFFERRHYGRIETPIVEFEEVFLSLNNNESRYYQFFDQHGKVMILRPDMTLPIGRVLATTNITLPVKLYYSGKVFRWNEALSGEYNEYLQAGIELIGYESQKAEMECLSCAIQLVERLEIEELQLEIGHSQIVDRIFNALNLENCQQEQLQEIIRSKNVSGMRRFCENFQGHPLYDFLLALPRLFGNQQVITQGLSLTDDRELISALKELQQIVRNLQLAFPETELLVDIGFVKDLPYYTGLLFKGYTSHVPECIFSGGRYNQLFSQFGLPDLPSIGVGFSLDQIYQSKARQRMLLAMNNPRLLIHYDEASWALANLRQQQEASAALSLFDQLAETIDYAQKWEIPEVLILVNNEEAERLRVGGAMDEKNLYCINEGTG